MTIAVVDVGGTHARFALAKTHPPRLASEPATMRTADHPSLASAWEAFVATLGARPTAAAIAVACPIAGDVLKFTNNPWTIRPATLAAELGIDDVLLMNDFGAVTHAVAALDPADIMHLCGPEGRLPAHGVISVVGPGTGLGVAMLVRRDGHAHVIETEGGHRDFAPVDAIEDALLARLRGRFVRVSVERVCSGPGLAHIFEALAIADGAPVTLREDRALWDAAILGDEPRAAAALDRFCLALGTACGDFALAHGAAAVVLAGGLPPRFLALLKRSGFGQRFRAKGRFDRMMAGIGVHVLVHPQPGLLGAAAAFAQRSMR